MVQATIPIQQSDVSAHYNDLHSLYQSIWGNHIHHGYWLTGKESIDEATRNLVQKVMHQGEFQPGDKICDIGCGYGATGKILAEELEAEVNGITITPKQYEVARKLKPKKGSLEVHLGDWLENSFASSSFDRALAIESSEHFPCKRSFFREASRVLKPGGTFTVCAWVASSSLFAWENKLLLVPICNEGRLPGLATIEDYRELFAESGFSDRQEEDISKRVRKTWGLVTARTVKRFFHRPSEVMQGIRSASGDFLFTPLRMWAAYHTGALRYVVMSARKLG